MSLHTEAEREIGEIFQILIQMKSVTNIKSATRI